MASTDKTIVLITGANSGIGWETAKALLQSEMQYHILLGARDLEKGNTALKNLENEVPETSSAIELIQIDVANDESISNAYEKIQTSHGRVDTLINNAG
jgi:NADP-dependent 3-hydroxy acid dehydrogenase YdfG